MPNSDGVLPSKGDSPVSGRSRNGDGAFGKGEEDGFKVLLPKPLVLPVVQMLFVIATF